MQKPNVPALPAHTDETARAADALLLVEDLKRQWLAMIDAISDPLSIVDADYTLHRQNLPYVTAARGRGELSIREFAGNKCYEVFAGRDAPCTHCRLTEALASGKETTWSTGDLLPDREFVIRVHAAFDDRGESGVARAVVHYHDVTQLRAMQENLGRADKLAALGKLAGGVAHEINSPLAGILAFAQMALREMDEEDPHKQDMREIEDAARKCKVIVEGLLGFARQDRPSDEKIFDLFECVRSTLRLASPLLKKHGIETHVFLGEKDGRMAPLKGNAGKFDQVLLNLVTNAIQAMKQGGALEIVGDVGERNVTLQIRDSGPGIEPSVIGRIFDPFFTTKAIGEGTGLGLSITYSIVKQHGGEISVQTQLGVGTTFTLELPLAELGELNEGAR